MPRPLDNPPLPAGYLDEYRETLRREVAGPFVTALTSGEWVYEPDNPENPFPGHLVYVDPSIPDGYAYGGPL